MSLLERYEHTLDALERVFSEIETEAPMPEWVEVPSLGQVWRFRERTIEAALIQKLARVATSLRASTLLLEGGLVQEVAILHRVLDELCEDILFLSMPLLGGERTERHEQYLEYFYMEEVDANGKIQRRPQVPREKVHAYITRLQGVELNPSDSKEALGSVTKVFGGFVHGASPQIMELYGGVPPKFHVAGMRGTPRIEEFEKSLQHYFFRGVGAFELVSRALGAEAASAQVHSLRKALETEFDVLLTDKEAPLTLAQRRRRGPAA